MIRFRHSKLDLFSESGHDLWMSNEQPACMQVSEV